MRQRAAWGALLAGCLRVGSGAAAELAVQDASACITADELSFRVTRALGQPLEHAGDTAFSVRVETSRSGYRAHIAVSDGSGHPLAGARTLVAATCDELMQALALAVAIAVGQYGEPASVPPVVVEPQPVRVASEVSGISEADEHPAIETLPESPTPGPDFAGSAWALGDTGTLPGIGLGAGLGFELRWPSFSLRAVGTFLPEREGYFQVPSPSSRGVSIGLLAGALLACVPVAVSPAALKLSVCAGGELGELSGSGIGVAVPHHQRTLWGAARFDASARWALLDTPLGFDVLVTAAAPLSRDDFALRDIGSVHRPASVVGRAGLGLSWLVD